MTTIGVAIITHNAKHHLPHCLPPYLKSSLKPKVLVVNSSSNDGTVELAQEMGAETLLIPRSEFNHGTTRERARKHLNTDIVVMATPDAYGASAQFLHLLIEPIQAGQTSIAYARQIPHEGASFFEAFPRTFNYPTASHMRDLNDIDQYGAYTFFCSNACAAYSNAALDAIGGFQPVLLGEDTVAVAQLLHQGHKIAYIAEAVVRHSHRYSLKQEFQRSFDTGLARRGFRHLIDSAGKDTARGKRYFKEMVLELSKSKPYLLPYAFLQTTAKWTGYQLGRRCEHAPTWLKRTLSSQKFYWNTPIEAADRLDTRDNNGYA